MVKKKSIFYLLTIIGGLTLTVLFAPIPTTILYLYNWLTIYLPSGILKPIYNPLPLTLVISGILYKFYFKYVPTILEFSIKFNL